MSPLVMTSIAILAAAAGVSLSIPFGGGVLAGRDVLDPAGDGAVFVLTCGDSVDGRTSWRLVHDDVCRLRSIVGVQEQPVMSERPHSTWARNGCFG